MSKETLNTILARLDERVKNFIDINGKEHVEIVKKIDDLAKHVNEELHAFDARVKILENAALIKKGEYISRKQIYRLIGTIVAIATTVLSALKYMKVI